MDSESFRLQGKQMVDFVTNYIKNIREQTVLPNVEPGYLQKILPLDPPNDALDFEDLMKQINEGVMPGMTHWRHPNFHAFFPTAFSFPSYLGSMLSDGLACVGINWQASPVYSELEMVVLDWLVKAMDLPEKFLSCSGNGGGTIIGSVSEATLMAMLVERNLTIKKFKQNNPEMTNGKIVDKMRIYFTEQTHGCVKRSCMMGLLKYTVVPTNDDESMNVDELVKIISRDKENNLIPLMVISCFGSLSLCAFDNLFEIGTACKALGVKCHVDADYLGSFLICPEYRKLARGIELINSFTFNPISMMKTHIDCSILWFDRRRSADEALCVRRIYLSHDLGSKTSELRDWEIPLGRKFRALKLWFVLNMYSIRNLQDNIRQHVRLAKLFAEKVAESEIFELVNEVKFGLVCFRIKGSDDKTLLLRDALLLDRSLYLSSGKIESKNKIFMRFICGDQSMEDDVLKAFDKITEIAMKL